MKPGSDGWDGLAYGRSAHSGRRLDAMTGCLPRIAWLSCLGAIAGMALVALSTGGSIGTETIPMQWGLHGRPAWYADTTIGLWTPVAILAVIAPSIFLKIRQASPQTGAWTWIGMIATFGFVLGVYAWHVSAVLAWAEAQR